MNGKGSLLLLIILICGLFRAAPAQEYSFSEWLTAGNLDNARMQALCQDHKGFMWTGTSRGLYRYDGYELEEVMLPGSSGVSVTCLFEDSAHRLWAGLENGSMYRSAGNYFLPVEYEGIALQNRIVSIAEDIQGNIWAGVYGEGILVMGSDTMYFIHSENGLSDNYIHTLVSDHSGKIWAGTDNGIHIFYPDTSGFSIHSLTIADGLPDFIVTVLAVHPDGRIAAGFHDRGFCLIDPDHYNISIPQQAAPWSYGPVISLLALENTLWVSSENGGLSGYDFRSGTLSPLEGRGHAFPSGISRMTVDLEGNIWLMNPAGIHRSFGEKLTFYYGFDGHAFMNVHTLLAGNNGILWLSDDTGLYSFNPDQKGSMKRAPLPAKMMKQKIMSLYEDPHGYIWAGTFGQGILRIDPENFSINEFGENDGLINGNVLTIAVDRRHIWFGTLGGVSRYTLDESSDQPFIKPVFENFGAEEGLSNHYIYHIYVDYEGKTWFATDGSGVFYYDEGKFINIAEGAPYAGEVIYSVVRDSSGTLWMNAAHNGLLKYDGNTVEKVFHDNAHKSGSFSGIAINSNNELIIAYDDGIDVLDIETGNVIHYEENAGLAGANPDLNTLQTDKEGNTWAGISRGLIRYAPSDHPFRKKPVPLIDKVAVFLQETEILENAVFQYHENHFTFYYTGLWYQQQEKVRYLVRLDGHDLSWMPTGNRYAVYSGLSPGSYTFRVKASLYDSFNGADEASFSFTIREPFWTRGWFYLIAGAAMLSVILVIIRQRDKWLKRKQAAYEEQIRFRFESLKSQINPHFLFNSFSTLIALIEEDGAAAVEYVEELSTLFRNVLDFQEEELITLRQEMEIIANYYKLQAKRYGSGLCLETNCPEHALDMKLPPLTLQILAENAIKHNVVSSGNPLTIHIFFDEKEEMLYVENNLLPRKDEVHSTGIGISNITKRFQLLTGRDIRVEKSVTGFRVGLPLIK
ncbi:MAG: histidine kinase [Bacteroidales bacterium]|nr:histidine kinase [Bacteroidales bacterium]